MTAVRALRPASRPRLTLEREGPWLIAWLDPPRIACSWAIVGGGTTRARAVAWREVRNQDLPPALDPAAFLREELARRGVQDAVGLLTSRALDTYTDHEVEHDGVRARCVATVGLGNALRAGDPLGITMRFGTINLLCDVSVPLTREALLEASAIATEAKAAVLVESGVTSRLTGRAATGTGTDCVVVTSPMARDGLPYAGKHTAVGSVLGAAVERAVKQGVDAWILEQGGAR